MNEQDYALIGAPFAELEDPREAMNQRHKFMELLVIAICAAICGADDWDSVELFGQSKEKWFRTFLELPNAPWGQRSVDIEDTRARYLRPEVDAAVQALRQKPDAST